MVLFTLQYIPKAIIYLKNAMQQELSIVPIRSLVPIKQISKFQTINRRYPTLICSSVYYIPVGLQVIRITLFLVSFDGRVYLNVLLQFFNSLPAPEMDLQYPLLVPLMDHQNNQAIPLHSEAIPMQCGAIPLGYGVFELPDFNREPQNNGWQEYELKQNREFEDE